VAAISRDSETGVWRVEPLKTGCSTVPFARCGPQELWPVVRRKLTQLNRVRDLRELAVPPGNRLEALAGKRKGQHSIRINQQYRVCFRWEGGYADEVEVTDYH
jgi:proteic killer suppression protein